VRGRPGEQGLDFQRLDHPGLRSTDIFHQAKSLWSQLLHSEINLNFTLTPILNYSSEPQGQELVYAARVSLDRSEMDIDGRRVALAAGMAVTVEIKTGERRVIEYLLSPLLRYKQGSLRER
jgi:hypothetical protein